MPHDFPVFAKDHSLYIFDILSAVQYMHSKEVVHRDLKLRNIVFDDKGKHGKLKIIDFGLSEIINNQNKNDLDNTVYGTLYYLAPGTLYIHIVYMQYIYSIYIRYCFL